MRIDRGMAAILAAGAVLLLSNLGNGRLWQDEAETAVLGRNILRYGYPRASDGINRVNPILPLREGEAWTYHSWLPMYLAAGSFRLFGAGTASARWPFALLGLLALWAAWRLFKRLTRNPLAARLAVLLMATNVPFLLHMRQCRYYAPALFFTLWAALAYRRFLKKRRFGGPELVLALNLLFHADHGLFPPVALALGLHFLWSRPGPEEWKRAGAAAGWVLILTLPWMVYLQPWQHHKSFSLREISHHFQFYFRQINRFIFPVVFWGIVAVPMRRLFHGLFGGQDRSAREGWRLAGLLLLVGLSFLVLVPEQRHFRYLIFLLPWLLLIQGAFLARLFQAGRPALGGGLLAVILLTDLVHYSAPRLAAGKPPRSLLLEFAGELAHPYRGPIDGAVELLQAQGRPGDSVKISYGDIPLIFYLPDRRIEPFLDSERFGRLTTPDWIILRRDWLPPGFMESAYYRRIVEEYEQILLDAPDIPWQNRPDPGYHRFRTDQHALPVIVFHRRDGKD